MTKSDRANFGSKLGVILASAGSAVGLGNIWRFPFETGITEVRHLSLYTWFACSFSASPS